MLFCFFIAMTFVGSSPALAVDQPGWEYLVEDLVRVDDMVVTEDEQVFFISVGDRRLCHLDRNGKLVHHFGSSGEGPGEFAAPFRLGYFPKTGHLAVVDGRRQKLILFEKDGTYLEEYSLPGVQLFGSIFEPDVVAFTNAKLAVDKRGQGVSLFFDHFRGQQRGGTSESWRKLLSFNKEQHADPQKMPNAGNNFIRFPWTPKVLMAGTPDHRFLYIGSNVDVDFARVEVAGGKTVGRIKGRVPRVVLLDDEINAHLNKKKRELGHAYRADQFKNPDFKPAVQKIFADKSGRLWVMLQGSWQAEKARYVVYDQQGKQQGSLEMNTGIHFVYADGSFLWTRGYDAQRDAWIVKKTAYSLKSH